MAEEAMTLYDRGSEASFPPAAERFLRAREGCGLTQDDVAARWGEPPSMYWDLELYDDEAFTVVSVEQLRRLAAVLSTSASVLLFGDEPSSEVVGVSYAEVITRLREQMANDRISVEQLGDQIGWELQPLLDDAGALGDLPVYALRSICRAAGVDWVGVLRGRAD